MVKKLFALGAVTALTGLVSAVTAAGCSAEVVSPPGTATPDGGGTDAKKTPTPPTPDPEEDGGEDPDVSCKAAGPFTPETLNPPAPQQASACDQTQIDALKDACTEDPAAAACEEARALAGNKSCAECIFGLKSDANWKVIVLDPGGTPPARYNQAGCVEHVTGVKGCGEQYSNIGGCIDTFCGKCEDESDFTDCNQEVLGADCKDFALDGPCGNAYQAKRSAISSTCFPKSVDNLDDIKAFFASMAKTACATKPSGTGDSGNQDAN